MQLDQVKQGLGGNVRLILSGAAPLSAHVEEFLRVVTCAHVIQGYGICWKFEILLTPWCISVKLIFLKLDVDSLANEGDLL